MEPCEQGRLRLKEGQDFVVKALGRGAAHEACFRKYSNAISDASILQRVIAAPCNFGKQFLVGVHCFSLAEQPDRAGRTPYSLLVVPSALFAEEFASGFMKKLLHLKICVWTDRLEFSDIPKDTQLRVTIQK